MKNNKIDIFFNFLNNNTFLIFFFYILVLVFVNLLFCKLYLIKQPNLIDSNGTFLISNISNGFGEVIKSINNGDKAHLLWVGEIKLYAARRLFIPYYLIAMNELNITSFITIHLIKNLFFGLIIFILIKNFNKAYNNIFLILCLFFIYYLPFNNLTTLGTEKEEGWLNYFTIMLFFLLVSNFRYKSIYIGFVLSMIFFLKGSMFFLTLIIPIIYFFLEKKAKYKYFPIFLVIISNLIWGTYTLKNAGFFAFGAKGSSMNASNLYMISTKDFNKTYPNIVPDIYLYRVKDIIKKEKINDEKEFIDKLMKPSINFIKENPYNFLYGIAKRIYVLTLNPFKDAQKPSNYKSNKDSKYKSNNPVRISNIFNKVVFNLSIVILFYLIFLKKEKNYFIKKLNYYYLSILILYLSPYIAVWLYDRHAVSIYILAHFYVLMIIANSNRKLFYSKA